MLSASEKLPLQADHQRKIFAAYARIAVLPGAAAACRKTSAPRAANPCRARRISRGSRARKVRRGRSSARSNNSAGLPDGGRADRARRLAPTARASPGFPAYARAPARRMPACTVRRRPVPFRKRRAAAYCWAKRVRPVRARPPPAVRWPSARSALAYWIAASGSFGLARNCSPARSAVWRHSASLRGAEFADASQWFRCWLWRSRRRRGRSALTVTRTRPSLRDHAAAFSP